jgi:hypothetical protein
MEIANEVANTTGRASRAKTASTMMARGRGSCAGSVFLVRAIHKGTTSIQA